MSRNSGWCRLRSFGFGIVLMGLAMAGSHAQTNDGKTIRIGMQLTGSAAQWAPYESALVDGQREHGCVEGKNLVITRRYGELQADRVRGLVAELGLTLLQSPLLRADKVIE